MFSVLLCHRYLVGMALRQPPWPFRGSGWLSIQTRHFDIRDEQGWYAKLSAILAPAPCQLKLWPGVAQLQPQASMAPARGPGTPPPVWGSLRAMSFDGNARVDMTPSCTFLFLSIQHSSSSHHYTVASGSCSTLFKPSSRRPA